MKIEPILFNKNCCCLLSFSLCQRYCWIRSRAFLLSVSFAKLAISQWGERNRFISFVEYWNVDSCNRWKFVCVKRLNVRFWALDNDSINFKNLCCECQSSQNNEYYYIHDVWVQNKMSIPMERHFIFPYEMHFLLCFIVHLYFFYSLFAVYLLLSWLLLLLKNQL